MKRFQCPSLNTPMVTGDGLLVRLPPLDVFLDGKQWQRLMQLAAQEGNGLVEITQRGNMQLRGFDHASAAHFTHKLPFVIPLPLPLSPVAISCEPDDKALHIFAYSPRFSRSTSPWSFVYRETQNTRDIALLARQLDAWLGQTTLTFAPKCSIVIEHTGGWGYGSLPADVRLRIAHGRYWIGVGGTAREARWYEVRSSHALMEAAKIVLASIAELGPYARGRDAANHPLLEEKLHASAWVIKRCNSISNAIQCEGEHIALGQMDDTHAVISLPFGASDVQALSALGEVCFFHDVKLRLIPQRRLLLRGIQAEKVLSFAEQVGYIVHDNDVRQRMFACQGAPGCASSYLNTREMATSAIPLMEKYASNNDKTLHISGCAKGCAHPAKATVTVVGMSEAGEDHAAIGMVMQGRARAMAGDIIVSDQQNWREVLDREMGGTS
ncbi:Precorrin-3B synthase [Halomonadaceae bacterium LMG 33818]|uniref:hypothetical protein n=1 Tax=Cernens ardua TaxID=3402176 RepID=UPI003EDCA997